MHPASPRSPPEMQYCSSTTPKKQEQPGQGIQAPVASLQHVTGGHAAHQSKEIIQALKISPPKEQICPQEHSVI